MSGKKQERGGRFAPSEDSATHRSTARALYEGTPAMTCELVAKQMNVAPATVRKWKSRASVEGAPWKPARQRLPGLSGAAGELANRFEARMADLGAPMDDATAAREAELDVAAQHAIELRARVIERHRLEWAGPRRPLYEAMQTGDLDKARMAKIMAEALTLMQAGERRSWGITSDSSGPEPTVVVVERVEGDPHQAGEDAGANGE